MVSDRVRKFVDVVCAAAAIVFTAGLAWYSVYALRAPHALPKDAPADQFSAYRAIDHAFACSTEPHPAGSANNERVAEYFLNELRAIGVETERVSKPEISGPVVQLRQAVIGRIPGTASTGSIAFCAHYDSVPYGPGATDDISGCVAMLEAARAFMQAPRMRNDIVFVFTDAEEIGGYGAASFCDHPLAKDVGIMCNLDVRGTSGPAMVYETSSGNGTLIAELRKATTAGVLPMASSLMYAVYERSPFGSDFSRFRHAGMIGYNIAFINKFSWYHTANDSPEHMTPESIQHFGAYVMGLARHFGETDFNAVNLESEDAVYFNMLGYRMAQYPMLLDTPLVVLAILALLSVIAWGLAHRKITLFGYVKGLLLFPFAAAAAAIPALVMFCIVFGYENVIHTYTVQFTYLPEPRALYDGNLYCYAMGLMALAAAGFLYCAAGRRLRAQDLHAAALTWLCPGLIACKLLLPGGSFVLMWPVLFGAAGLTMLCLGDREKRTGPARLLLASLCAVPALCLLPPLWTALMWMLSILAAPALAVFAVLLLLNLMPVIVLLGRVRRAQALFGAMAAASLLLLSTGLIISRPSKERPLVDSVAYVANLDTHEAWWLSQDNKVDEWTRQFFPEETRGKIGDILPGKRGDDYLHAPAPLGEHLRGVYFEPVRDEVVDGKRRVTVRLKSGDYPFEAYLRQVEGPEITAASIDGVSLRQGRRHRHEENPSRGSLQVFFRIMPPQGYEFTFETQPGEGVTFEAFSEAYGLPEIPGIQPRPDYIVPQPNTMRHGISLHGQQTYITNRITVPASSTGSGNTQAAPDGSA